MGRARAAKTTNPADLRVATYARMSQDRSGEMLGLQRQVEECNDLAAREGMTVAHAYDDNDLSAYSGKTRPGFEEMLKAMGRGEIDVLVCWHPDRLYRRLADLSRLMEIAEVHRVRIRTVNGGDLDLSTSAGRMLATILGSVAVQESAHKGERQFLANQQRRDRGVWSKEGIRPGQRPFGYTKEGKPFEDEAKLLKKAATDVLGKKSLRSIAIAWNEAGVTTTRGNKWTNLQLGRVLVNPLYAGLVAHEGKVVGEAAAVDEGGWESLLDRDIHQGLVAFLGDPSRKRASTFEIKHQGSGVYRCEACGGKMYMGLIRRGPGKPARMTYVCRHDNDLLPGFERHVARSGDPLDKLISLAVVERLRTKLAGDEGRLVDDDDEDGIDVVMVTSQMAALRERLDAMAVQCALGEIDRQQLASATAALKPRMSDLQALLDAQTVKDVETDPVENITKDGPKGVAINWAKASPAMRGKVIDGLMTVTVKPTPRGMREFDDQYVDIQWRSR